MKIYRASFIFGLYRSSGKITTPHYNRTDSFCQRETQHLALISHCVGENNHTAGIQVLFVSKVRRGRLKSVVKQGWVAWRRPRPTFRQGCTCWVSTGDHGVFKWKLSLPQKVGCAVEVVTQSGTSNSMHLGWVARDWRTLWPFNEECFVLFMFENWTANIERDWWICFKHHEQNNKSSKNAEEISPPPPSHPPSHPPASSPLSQGVKRWTDYDDYSDGVVMRSMDSGGVIKRLRDSGGVMRWIESRGVIKRLRDLLGWCRQKIQRLGWCLRDTNRLAWCRQESNGLTHSGGVKRWTESCGVVKFLTDSCGVVRRWTDSRGIVKRLTD